MPQIDHQGNCRSAIRIRCAASPTASVVNCYKFVTSSRAYFRTGILVKVKVKTNEKKTKLLFSNLWRYENSKQTFFVCSNGLLTVAARNNAGQCCRLSSRKIWWKFWASDRLLFEPLAFSASLPTLILEVDRVLCAVIKRWSQAVMKLINDSRKTFTMHSPWPKNNSPRWTKNWHWKPYDFEF